MLLLWPLGPALELTSGRRRLCGATEGPALPQFPHLHLLKVTCIKDGFRPILPSAVGTFGREALGGVCGSKGPRIGAPSLLCVGARPASLGPHSGRCPGLAWDGQLDKPKPLWRLCQHRPGAGSPLPGRPLRTCQRMGLLASGPQANMFWDACLPLDGCASRLLMLRAEHTLESSWGRGGHAGGRAPETTQLSGRENVRMETGDSGFRRRRSPSIITDALEALGVEVQARLGTPESKPGSCRG